MPPNQKGGGAPFQTNPARFGPVVEGAIWCGVRARPKFKIISVPVRLNVDNMSTDQREKRLRELNEELDITRPRVEPSPQSTLDEAEEREYLKKKLNYPNISE
jgi:hypothetical protein